MESEIYCCICFEYIGTVDLPEDELTPELLDQSLCPECQEKEE